MRHDSSVDGADETVSLLAPRARELPVLASIPHSGLRVPDDIAASFTAEHAAWLRNTDWYLDRVYDSYPSLV
jgi:N-formylglutamate amidohydrolase